jgi:hypothetical protein
MAPTRPTPDPARRLAITALEPPAREIVDLTCEAEPAVVITRIRLQFI